MSKRFSKLGRFDADGNPIQRNGRNHYGPYAPEVEDWEIKEELLASLGNAAIASARLNMDRQELIDRVGNSHELRQLFYNMRQSRLDAIEDALYNTAIGGNVRAQIFYLRTQGRDRGYGDVQTHVNVNLDELTPMQLRQLANGVPLEYVLSEQQPVSDERSLETTRSSDVGIQGTSAAETIDSTGTPVDLAEPDIPETDV